MPHKKAMEYIHDHFFWGKSNFLPGVCLFYGFLPKNRKKKIAYGLIFSVFFYLSLWHAQLHMYESFHFFNLKNLRHLFESYLIRAIF